MAFLLLLSFVFCFCLFVCCFKFTLANVLMSMVGDWILARFSRKLPHLIYQWGIEPLKLFWMILVLTQRLVTHTEKRKRKNCKLIFDNVAVIQNNIRFQ